MEVGESGRNQGSGVTGMLQQEIKRVLMFLFAEPGGSEVDIREIFLFAEGTSQGYKGIPRIMSFPAEKDVCSLLAMYEQVIYGYCHGSPAAFSGKGTIKKHEACSVIISKLYAAPN
ncbi:hypothetical protein TURU_010546 [Turdus rufiventris]|nr:hypothetical protein TURU_010546 [Turdus rufiventris]